MRACQKTPLFAQTKKKWNMLCLVKFCYDFFFFFFTIYGICSYVIKIVQWEKTIFMQTIFEMIYKTTKLKTYFFVPSEIITVWNENTITKKHDRKHKVKKSKSWKRDKFKISSEMLCCSFCTYMNIFIGVKYNNILWTERNRK